MRRRRPMHQWKRGNGSKLYHWDRNILNATSVPAGTAITVPMVVVADYQGNANLSPSGITLRRTVGSFSIAINSTTTTTEWWACVYCQDQDGTNISPADGAQLTDERVLWTDCGGSRFSSNIGWQTNEKCVFDIKQAVKLRDMDVKFAILANTSTGPLTIHGVFSCLLQGDAT